MRAKNWTNAMQSLVLIRIGQELGTDGPVARAVHDILELLCSLPAQLFGHSF